MCLSKANFENWKSFWWEKEKEEGRKQKRNKKQKKKGWKATKRVKMMKTQIIPT